MNQPTNDNTRSSTVGRTRVAVLLFAAAIAVAAAMFGIGTSPGRSESAGVSTSPGRGHFGISTSPGRTQFAGVSTSPGRGHLAVSRSYNMTR